MSGAEAMAVIGLAGTAAQFISIAAKVLRRRKDFEASVGRMPESFQDISNTLQLLVTCVSTTETMESTGGVSADRQIALKPVIDRCREQIHNLDTLLQKYLPKNGESRWRTRKKAYMSVRQEQEIHDVKKIIDQYVIYVTYYETTRASSIPTDSASAFVQRSSSDIQASVPTTTQFALFTVPFDRDNQFVARHDLLSKISATLDQHHRVGLFGVGGAGKTQLAVECCYRFRDAYPGSHVLWIHASSLARLTRSYQRVAELGALPGRADPEVDTVALVNNWLERECTSPWLIVFDNVDDLDMLLDTSPASEPMIRNRAKYLPLPQSSRGLILVTTRDKRISQGVLSVSCSVLVPQMSRSEATIFLKQRLEGQEELDATEIEELFKILGHLPLAIAQATAFIHENSISVEQYLAIIRGRDANVQELFEENPASGDMRRDQESDTSIFKTWRLSFESIRREQPRAADLLALMAMLDRHSIPHSLLVREESKVLDDVKSIGILRAFSLIEAGIGSKTYSLHRLVQLATQRWLHINGEIERWKFTALKTVAEVFPSGEYDTIADCEILAPHASAVLQYILTSNYAWKRDFAYLSHKKGYFDYRQGRFKTSMQALETAVSMQTEVLGGEHLDTLSSIGRLVRVHCKQGQFNDAQNLGLEALKICNETVGATHETTLNIKRGLAYASFKKGDYVDSEKLLQECMVGCIELGIDNSIFAYYCRGDLALTLQAHRRYREAEILQELVLANNRIIHGPRHQDTLTSMHNLALTYLEQGRIEEAQKLMVEVVSNRKTVLGEEHPATLTSVRILTNLSLDKQEAEKTYIHIVEKHREVLGQDHPLTLCATWELAMTYAHQSRWDEAEQLGTPALSVRRRILGDTHPVTIDTMRNLAVIYRELDRYRDAEDLGLEALKRATKALGEGNPTTDFVNDVRTPRSPAKGSWA